MSDNSQPSTNRDQENLKLFSILHYIYAAFGVLGIIFLAVHFLVVNTFIIAPEMWENSNEEPPPDIIFTFFMVFYGISALLFISGTVANFLTAYYLQKTKNRMFCIVIAAINTLNMPLGTLLGVFTILHLIKPTVIELYESNQNSLK